MSEYSDMINKQFDADVLRFQENAPSACDHKTAMRLLAEFNRDSIDFSKKFWANSVDKYLPAVAEGTMFLGQESFEHEQALKIARERADALSIRDVAHAFVYGVARGIPAYRTGLPAYLHIKNIPEHDDSHLRVTKVHTSPNCSFCDFVAASAETKMSFLWINSNQYCRVYNGGYLGGQSPTASSFLLREFIKMPKVVATQEDYRRFIDSLELAEQLSPESKIGAYKELLKNSKVLPFKIRELQPYLDILGYLDILHTEEHRGISKMFIRHQDMQDPDEHKNDYGYPVRFWRGKNGVDWSRVRELFGNLFD